MAHTLLPGLLELAKKNYRQITPINIFEVGKIFKINSEGTPEETKVLSVLMLQKKNDNTARTSDNYLHTKQLSHLISHIFQIQELEFVSSQHIPYYHPNKQASITY